METPIQNVMAGLYLPITHEAITVAAAAIGITAGLLSPSGTRKPIRTVMTLETANIRYTWDGTTPTASVGHLARPNDVITLLGYKALSNFRAFRSTGTSGVLRVTLEG